MENKELVLELLADLKAQIQQADNQAASRGAINLIDTLRAAKQTVTLLEFEISKHITTPPARAETDK